MIVEVNRDFNPEIDTMFKIAKYFSCTTDEVIRRTMPNTNSL